jgi:acyl carrier protein
LKEVVFGVIERFAPRDQRHKLSQLNGEIRLSGDLGFDSLTLIETVALLEEVLRVDISNDELAHLRTVTDVQRFVETKVPSGLSSSLR